MLWPAISIAQRSVQIFVLLLSLQVSADTRSFRLPDAWQAVSISNAWVREAAYLQGWLLKPSGSGAFPAAVLLHGCTGVVAKHQAWAEELVEWGYAVLILDSFENRGGKPICRAWDGVWARYNRLRPADAYAALAFLDGAPDIDATRVALIGWSYGATMTLAALNDNRPVEPPAAGATDLRYRAGVAFYPSCWQYRTYLQGSAHYRARAPLFILQGESDNWTLPEHCRRLVEQSGDSRHLVSLRLYADAYHSFDDRSQPPTRLWGVRLESKIQPWGNVVIGYSKTAHHAAREDVRELLGRLLH